MSARVVGIVGVIAVAVVLIFALGLAAEGLGNWADSHPRYRLVVWIAWNLGVAVVLAATVWRWRTYRRAHKRNSYPGAG